MDPKIKNINQNIIFISLGGVDSNIYVIDKKVLIDTTTGLHTKTLEFALKKANINKDEIKSIILTHEHFDHIGGINLFPLAKVLAANTTAQVLDTQDPKLSYSMFFSGQIPKRKIDVILNDKDIIRLGNLKLEVLKTPGHSDGSICLYDAENKILFSGDTVFENTMGRMDLLGGSEKEMEESLKRLTSIDVEVILPGHGNIVESNGNIHIKSILDNLRI
ncbi:MBL fold metallo-hydrolase [archaeon]|nr:MBL fold metallo-hydrolase [archaeon]